MHDRPATGLVDCGNWAESARWTVPADAVSGIYFASCAQAAARPGRATSRSSCATTTAARTCCSRRPTRPGRPTTSTAATASTPAAPDGRAYKVSYNRPFTTRAVRGRGLGLQRRVPDGPLARAQRLRRQLLHRGRQRSAAARELREHGRSCRSGTTSTGRAPSAPTSRRRATPGVNLAFFSGNEVFWKTRWENDHRTLVTYKETHANAKIDPLRATWTGTWRDPRPFNPAGRPARERADRHDLHGQRRARPRMQVPGRGRQAAPVAWHDRGRPARRRRSRRSRDDTLGYEWDEDLDNGARPAGLVRLSSTTVVRGRQAAGLRLDLRGRARRRTT